MKDAIFKHIKPYEFFIVALIAAPMLFLNVHNSIPWGDDFAIYVHQAINLVRAKPFDQTSYIFLSGYTDRPASAPVGFSLMLAPVIYCFGFKPLVLNIFMSVLFIAWMFVGYIFFRRFFAAPTSLIMLVTAFYPNFMFWLKVLITSDVPFSVFFIGLLLLFESKKISGIAGWIFAGIFAGFIVNIRTAGFVILPAFSFYTFYTYLKPGAGTVTPAAPAKAWLNLAVFAFSMLLTWWLIDYVLFKPTGYNYVAGNLQMWSLKKMPAAIWFRLKHYPLCYLELFRTGTFTTYFNIFFSYLIGVITAYGFFVKARKEFTLIDVATICYLGLIFIGPTASDYRYIIPVHVFLIIYLFFGLRQLGQFFHARTVRFLQAGFVILIITMFYGNISNLVVHRFDTLPGPYETISQETFSYVSNSISDTDLIVFDKPHALALYTNKKVTVSNDDFSSAESYKRLRYIGARYYLYDWAIQDEGYKQFIKDEEARFKVNYKNWQFTLYEDTTRL